MMPEHEREPVSAHVLMLLATSCLRGVAAPVPLLCIGAGVLGLGSSSWTLRSESNGVRRYPAAHAQRLGL